MPPDRPPEQRIPTPGVRPCCLARSGWAAFGPATVRDAGPLAAPIQCQPGPGGDPHRHGRGGNALVKDDKTKIVTEYATKEGDTGSPEVE